jgi:hypothetical protein
VGVTVKHRHLRQSGLYYWLLLGSVFKGLDYWLWGVWPYIGGRVSSFGRLVVGVVDSGLVIVLELTAFFFGGAIVGFFFELRTWWAPLLGSK